MDSNRLALDWQIFDTVIYTHLRLPSRGAGGGFRCRGALGGPTMAVFAVCDFVDFAFPLAGLRPRFPFTFTVVTGSGLCVREVAVGGEVAGETSFGGSVSGRARATLTHVSVVADSAGCVTDVETVAVPPSLLGTGL